MHNITMHVCRYLQGCPILAMVNQHDVDVIGISVSFRAIKLTPRALIYLIFYSSWVEIKLHTKISFVGCQTYNHPKCSVFVFLSIII